MKTEALKQALDRARVRRSPSAAHAATRRRAVPRSASSRCAASKPRAGTRATSGPSPGGSSTRRARPRERAVRVFPLSNWTELDVWRLRGRLENIPVVPLYLARSPPGRPARRIVWIMRDDERIAAAARARSPETRTIRFRTLGCYPLTGAVESEAARRSRTSSRRCSASRILRTPGPHHRS